MGESAVNHRVRNLPWVARTTVFAGILWAAGCPSLAQQIGLDEIKSVDAPVGAAVGKPVKFTVRAGSMPSNWCGFKVDFGDGDVRHVKVSNLGGAGDHLFPVALEKTFQRAGTFDVKVEGIRVTTRPPCPGGASARIQVSAPSAPAALPTASLRCPEPVPVRNASGEVVNFGLAQLVRDAGGVPAAREQVTRRIIDAQDKALDDKLPDDGRLAARRFADSLKTVRDQLEACK